MSPAKLDNDGWPDLFAVDGFSGTTFALLGDGSGGFTVSGQLYGSGFIPEDVTARDLDGDGYDDAATSVRSASPSPPGSPVAPASSAA
ncbi:MAG: FG-GAP repeat domain-containing protein [Haloechinothrix sp.]